MSIFLHISIVIFTGLSDEVQGLIQKIGAGGATEIRGQIPCADRHVWFAFEGKI